MKRVICIRKDTDHQQEVKALAIFNTHLTIGKVYDVVKITKGHHQIQITNDGKVDVWYDRECFISLEEHRDIQLKQIGI